MIRVFRDSDLFSVMQLWLETNVQAHSFIHPCYWSGHYDPVKTALPQAETYVYESESTRRIVGFIGLTDDYINGCFVKDSEQSKGIGKQLLDHAKNLRSRLTLQVYEKNTRAVKFYQQEGFTIESEHVDGGTNQKEFVMVWNR